MTDTGSGAGRENAKGRVTLLTSGRRGREMNTEVVSVMKRNGRPIVSATGIGDERVDDITSVLVRAPARADMASVTKSVRESVRVDTLTHRTASVVRESPLGLSVTTERGTARADLEVARGVKKSVVTEKDLALIDPRAALVLTARLRGRTRDAPRVLAQRGRAHEKKSRIKIPKTTRLRRSVKVNRNLAHVTTMPKRREATKVKIRRSLAKETVSMARHRDAMGRRNATREEIARKKNLTRRTTIVTKSAKGIELDTVIATEEENVRESVTTETGHANGTGHHLVLNEIETVDVSEIVRENGRGNEIETENARETESVSVREQDTPSAIATETEIVIVTNAIATDDAIQTETASAIEVATNAIGVIATNAIEVAMSVTDPVATNVIATDTIVTNVIVIVIDTVATIANVIAMTNAINHRATSSEVDHRVGCDDALIFFFFFS